MNQSQHKYNDMTKVLFFVDSDGKYKGFRIDGHTGYADNGEDIVCAAVSALSQNTVNSIEAFTDDRFSCEVDDGQLVLNMTGKHISAESQLLLNALVLGLENIQQAYGNEFINIRTEEV